jgi:hypothetical protein
MLAMKLLELDQEELEAVLRAAEQEDEEVIEILTNSLEEV